MGKTLLNTLSNLGRGIKRKALLATAIVSLSGCQPIINPQTNYAPTALFSSTKNSIKVGENLSFTAEGKDDNGKEDIIEYKIAEDKNGNNEIDVGEELIKQNSPIINYSWTSQKAGTFKFIEQCTDKEGSTGRANLEIVVSEYPPVTTTTTISPVTTTSTTTTTTTIPPVTTTSTTTTTTTIPPVTTTTTIPVTTTTTIPITTTTTIPYINRAPNITSYPITTVNEKNSYNYQVMANDPEGDRLTYSITEPSWLSISSTGLVTGIVPSTNADTNCSVKINVSDGKNVIPHNFTLIEKNLLDITGNLQDVETLATQAGEVRLYDTLNNAKIGTTTTANGDFTIQASSPASQIKLQARFNKLNNSETSYIRTLTLDGTRDYDLTNKIRITKYPTFGSTPSDFREFMKGINTGEGYFPDKDGLTKWNLDNLFGIEILFSNPDTTRGSFSSTQQDIVINKIKDPTDIGAYVKGKDLSKLIQKDNSSTTNKHYTFNGKIITGVESGWIVIVPDNNLVDGWGNSIEGKAEIEYLNSRATGIINRARIKIRPEHAAYNDSVLTHEFGHVFIAPNGEAPINLTTLSKDKTIMDSSGTIIKPGVADIKAGQIIYETTYLPREQLDDILGMNWMN